MPSEPNDDLVQEKRRIHYELEVRLADRLRTAPASDRPRVYGEVYDELFSTILDHSQLVVDPARRELVAKDRLKLVKRFCDRNAALLEIGAGDCEFSLAASREVGRVVAVDVSAEILNFHSTHENLEVYVTDGTTFPLEDDSIDVVFSDQLIEHLHPEDVATQMREVRRVLSPKGVYVCITPNRANGPHDISGYFDDRARGLHLREYNSTELREVFRASGFDQFRFYAGGRGRYVRIPGVLLTWSEQIYSQLPQTVRRRLRTWAIVNAWLGLNVAAGRS
jgi:ubiquinone/menaquinone biosynthesis C-methylase UbiE